jgi:cyanophycin synthetase
MKILDISVMRGPNLWSIRRQKLIVMILDLEEMEALPTSKIEGFGARLQAALPSIVTHRCSYDHEGGFLKRVEEGTWMGHVIEHIALEMQTLAGMDTGFGRTRETAEKGVYNVVFSYIEEKVGVFVAKAATAFAQALINNEAYDLEKDLQEMREIREEVRLGPSTGGLVDEAVKRGIPFIRLNKYSLVQLGYGVNQRRIQATVASTTGSIAVEIACDKDETKNVLGVMNVPVPKGDTCRTEDDLERTVRRIGYPLVIKPVDGNHGKGATIGINTWEEAQRGFALAKERSRYVIVEQFVTGHDFRLLVINYQFVAAALRTPAAVTGDGKSTLTELINEVNKDPRRGYGHEKVLTSIKVDDNTQGILDKKGLTLDHVLPEGEELYLKTTANLSTGGTSTDVTDMVHPDNIFMAERIARIVGLDICGIDIMSPDISVPFNDNRGCVLEVNAAPGFRMHLAPTKGLARNVAEPVIDMLYPPGASARIPIIAVTGTNGKTTTTRLIAHLMKNMGHKVGFTTSDGIYIQNRMLEKGDCTGPRSAEFVLMDPTVDFAVLECARGGMLRSGLGFSACNVGIVTNVAADHLGMKGINTVEDMARVKAIVPESVLESGYAILNADDDLVYAMRKEVKCRVALFSMEADNKRVLEHCENGGLAAIAENGFITICKGTWKLPVAKIVNIPLTMGGKAIFMVQNILPATLSAYTQGMKIQDINNALLTFIPSAATTPGRLNVFQFKNFEMLLDFAHNPAGFRAIEHYVHKINAKKKIAIFSAAGDRRDEDIIEMGKIAAATFDEIVIHEGKHLRGRDADAMLEMLKDAFLALAPTKKVHIVKTERDAIVFGMKNAPKGSHITLLGDVVTEALDFIQKLKEEEANFEITHDDIPNL